MQFAKPLRVTLAARSEFNREAVARAIALVAPGTKISCTGLAGPDFERSLAEADAIVVQIRVGGYAARLYDETFPLAYDICGDEGLGPGGLAAAWRTWPVLKDLLAKIVASGSRARVVLLTSPIGILTRACLDEFPTLDLAGICELPYVTLAGVAAGAGAELESIEFSYAGVNHLGWFTAIEERGRNLVPAAVKPSWMPERDAVPLKYLRLHYDRKAMAAEQRGAAPRAQALSELADRAFATYATGDRDSIERVLTERAAPWYEHALAPFLGAVSGEPTDAVFFLTVRNRGYLPWLAADEVVEVPHRFRDGAFVPNPAISAVPEGARAVLDALVAYERNAASAVRTRDPEAIASALADHPWVEAPAAAEALAAAVGSAHANALS